MGEYAAFILILLFGFACGCVTGQLIARKRILGVIDRAIASKSDANTQVEAFGFFDNKVEGGTMGVGRRRDDNRAQRAPEEPWQ